jgi:hypothetical protein
MRWLLSGEFSSGFILLARVLPGENKRLPCEKKRLQNVKYVIWWGGAAAKPPHHPTKDTIAGAFGPRTPTE